MLGKAYGDQADGIKPSYERYGFQPMQWNQYGYDCFSPTLLMGPASNIALYGMVHVPMMIGMIVLNFAMDNTLYTGFATMMQPFISQMYNILNPWIYLIVPIGVGLAWVGSKGSLHATVKAGAWGVFMISVFLLMGNSTSQIVTWSTNAVTEVAGTAACGMSAAADGDDEAIPEGEQCDSHDPLRSVNEALWYGVPYQTWLVGQVGSEQAAADRAADENEGQVSWGAAILNANYLGTEVTGEGRERGGGIDKSGAESVDADGKEVLKATEAWNGLPTPRTARSPHGARRTRGPTSRLWRTSRSCATTRTRRATTAAAVTRMKASGRCSPAQGTRRPRTGPRTTAMPRAQAPPK